MKLFTLAALAAVVISAPAAFAAETVIQGFEGSQIINNTSPNNQSSNRSTGSGGGNTDTNYITEGARSSVTDMTWTVGSGAVTLTDAYERDNPSQLHWSMRGDYTGGILVPKSYDGVRIDVYNASSYAVDAAILINDGAYKRNPWKSLTPGAWTTLEWEFARDNDNLAPAVTGNSYGPLSETADWNFRGVCLHTTTEPGDGGVFKMYTDNFRGYSGQDDVTPPAAPVVLSVGQGSAPGKLAVSWKANDPADGVAKYTVKYLNAASYNLNFNNRLSYENAVATDFAATATSGEIDVTTGEPCYIVVSATDGATPKANESATLWPLAACLNPDGSATKFLYVPELKRWTDADASAITYQYNTNETTYYAPAFAANNMYFSSASAVAIQEGLQSLVKLDDGFVMWCNGVDGLSSETPMTDASCEKLTAYVNAGGKLVVSGSQWLAGITAETATETAKGFAAALKTASNGAATGPTIDLTGFEPFGDAGVFYTSADTWYLAAGYATAHTGLLATDSAAQAVGSIKDATDAVVGNAMVVNNNQTIALGFGFEQVRHVIEESTSTDMLPDAMQKRADLMKTFKDYLVPASGVSDWSLF